MVKSQGKYHENEIKQMRYKTVSTFVMVSAGKNNKKKDVTLLSRRDSSPANSGFWTQKFTA